MNLTPSRVGCLEALKALRNKNQKSYRWIDLPLGVFVKQFWQTPASNPLLKKTAKISRAEDRFHLFAFAQQ